MVPLILQDAQVMEVINAFLTPDDFYFSKQYPTANAPDDLLRWTVYHKDVGMAPMTDRGVPAPIFKGGGLSEMFARGAFISEKVEFTEEDLNKTKLADSARRQAQEYLLMERLEELVYRNYLRREWLAAQVAFNMGKIAYQDIEGHKFDIDYNFPAENYIADLGTNKEWGTGSGRDPIGDCRRMMQRIKSSTGSGVTAVIMNSNTLAKRLVSDTNLQGFFKNSEYGVEGLNFQADPVSALRWLFRTPLIEYDESMPITLRVLSITDQETFVVEDPSLIEVGTEVIINNIGDIDPAQAELAVVAAVNKTTGVVTFANAVTKVFYAGRCVMQANIPFLKDDRVVFIAGKTRGKPLFTWLDSPTGLSPGLSSGYGIQSKTWVMDDPDVVYTRVQRMGLWALHNTRAIGYIDVG